MIYHLSKVINYISESEYQQIVSTFIVRTNKEFNCHLCKEASKKRKDGEKIRALKGCYEPQKLPVFRHGKDIYYKCPANYQSIEVGNYFDLYFSNESLSLTERLTMPSKLVELFLILDNLVNELRTANDKRSKRNTHSRGKRSS